MVLLSKPGIDSMIEDSILSMDIIVLLLMISMYSTKDFAANAPAIMYSSTIDQAIIKPANSPMVA